MKSTHIIFILTLLVFSVSVNICLGIEFNKLNDEHFKLHRPALYDANVNQPLHFIWNDDEESFPMDGELIKVEFTKNDTIYLAPSNLE